MKPARLMKCTVLALLALPSVASAEYPKSLKDVTAARPGETLVLGGIKFIRDGKVRKCSTGLNECILIVLPADSSRAMAYSFRGDAPFTWSLPPGEYSILAYEVAYPGTLNVPLGLRFTVPADAKAVYIGDLLFLMQGYAHRAGLGDLADAATQRYRAAHPEATDPPVKGLIDQEPIRGTPAAKVSYICDAEWGLVCTDEMKGVTPTSPAAIKGYAPVASLTPELAWQPSTVPGMTYDLELFEAASYTGIKDARMPGHVVAYREGLTSPSWKPEEPLKPGERYLWSVRLRKGNSVSNWSTRSHFSFYIIGYSSGSGDYFNFSTPPAPAGK